MAFAHHSHALFYDSCTTVTIDGRVTRADWRNPHSLIDVETDNAVTYHVEWMAVQALARQTTGAPRDAVTVGARVVVIAHPLRDAAAIHASFPDLQGNPVANTVDPTQIRRADNTFSWSMPSVVARPNCGER